MPKMPKWIADKSEKIWNQYYHSVKVTHLHCYNPKLKLVQFVGDIPENFLTGQVVEFRVSETEYRHYTPYLYNVQKGICEIIFYLHQKGPGSIWANDLKVGDDVKLIGPGGKMNYQFTATHHFVFGDETSLGFMLAMEQEALKQKHTFAGIVELTPEHIDWMQYWEKSKIKAVESSWQQPAQNCIDRLSKADNSFWSVADETFFYLTGRTKSIQKLKKFLIAKGISNKQIRTYPYWTEGKKGL